MLPACLLFKVGLCKPASFLNGKETSFYFVDPQFNWLSLCHPSSNSSHLCVCPPVNTTEGITASFNESSLCSLLNLQARPPSAWLLLCSLYLSHQFLSSATPLLHFTPTSSYHCPSLLIPLNSASFEEVRLLSA